MLCDICHKKEAIIHFKQVAGGETLELHLCEECAQDKGVNLFSMEKIPFEEHLPLADLLAGFGDTSYITGEKKTAGKCPNCGITYADFKNIGKLGCSECYRTFKNQLLPLLNKIQGSIHHVGKIPGIRKKTGEDRVSKLKQELKETIEKEKYEKAAVIRDKIKKIEKKQRK